MPRRVAITGLGPVTAVGIGIDDFWHNILSAKNNYSEIDRFDLGVEHQTRIASQISDRKRADMKYHLDNKTLLDMRKLNYDVLGLHFAHEAAQLALKDADLDVHSIDTKMAGVIFGEVAPDPGVGKTNKNSTYKLLYGQVTALPGSIARRYAIKGPCMSVSSACSGGNSNVGEAFMGIRNGRADVMIAGAVSTPLLAPFPFDDLDSPGCPMSKRNDTKYGMRPFDRERDGFVLGEGACALVLEELGHAERRGANIHAEITGYSFITEHGMHALDITPEGYQRAIADALRMGESDIENRYVYVNAHGTATRNNDVNESIAVKKVFGNDPSFLFISSCKGSTGHVLDASNVIEIAASAYSIEKGVVPPTAGLQNVDPECAKGLVYLQHPTETGRVDLAVSNAAGFWGSYSSIVLKRYEG